MAAWMVGAKVDRQVAWTDHKKAAKLVAVLAWISAMPLGSALAWLKVDMRVKVKAAETDEGSGETTAVKRVWHMAA